VKEVRKILIETSSEGLIHEKNGVHIYSVLSFFLCSLFSKILSAHFAMVFITLLHVGLYGHRVDG
jgi:hypothetical protein